MFSDVHSLLKKVFENPVIAQRDPIEDYYCFNVVAFRSLAYNIVCKQQLPFDVKDASHPFLVELLKPFLCLHYVVHVSEEWASKHTPYAHLL